MWIRAGFLLVGALAFAQTPNAPNAASAALIRGVLLERDSQAASGQFSVRTTDNQVLRYQFDRKTYVEREHDLIDVPRLRPGEKVEVVSDAVTGSALRYARTIHVLDDAPPPRPLSQGRYRAYRSADDRNIPTGNLTFSGVVFRIGPDRLTLHTRTGGEQSIQLRKDTRYLQNGDIVDADKLAVNTRVFIRAGKDLYDQVEAYQVIWGTILDPK
jgi:hypothetical protein